MIPESILRRKGSRNTASVPTEVLSLLNQGSLETVNLCEWLVVDQLNLAERKFPKFGWQKLLPTLRERFAKHMPLTAPKKLLLIGSLLAEHFTTPASIRSASQLLLVQPSDIVRSWGAYLIGLNAGLPLNDRFHLIRPYAADPNMSTREIAWLALREATIADLEMSILALSEFPMDPDANIRRFASELTRPRGVWCRHIQTLKKSPWIALPLIEPLKSDPSKYVRDSVGNWLNDASKSAPDWVTQTCLLWQEQSPTAETSYIVKRALRTIRNG